MFSNLFRISKPAMLVSLTAIAGCTGSTDPTTATFPDNLANLNSGEYDRQIAQNKAWAAAIEAQNNSATRRNAQLEKLRDVNQREITALRKQIEAVKVQGDKAHAASASDPVKLKQVQALDNQLVEVERDVLSAPDPSVLWKELEQIKLAYHALSI